MQEFVRLSRVALREREASQATFVAQAAAGNDSAVLSELRRQLTNIDVIRLMDLWYLSDGLQLSTKHLRDRTTEVYEAADSVMTLANSLTVLLVAILYFGVVRSFAACFGMLFHCHGLVVVSPAHPSPPRAHPFSTVWCCRAWTWRSSAPRPCCSSSQRTPS